MTETNGASSDPLAVARIFISSTFKDMQVERDVLVKEVFPSLRQTFRNRGIEVTEVDLRWGVTEDEVAIDVCLAEVARCSPFFLGLLGERYGSVLTPERLAESASVGPEMLGRSLTEIEIEFGVFASSEGLRNAAFLSRETLDADTPADLGAEAREKLAALKARLRAAGALIVGYSTPADFARLALNVLTTIVVNAAPQVALSPEATEDLAHASYARDRRTAYVRAGDSFDALELWAADEASPMLISGASGVGKSALLANWSAHRRAQNRGDLVFEHYLAASPSSQAPDAILRRLWKALDPFAGAAAPPSEAELPELTDAIAARLVVAAEKQAAASCAIFIVLDGLEASHEATLSWLPSTLPENVFILASSLPGDLKDNALSRGWRSVEMSSFCAAEGRSFAVAELARWGKKLSEANLQRLEQRAAGTLPLFLRILLDELRFSASHASLDEVISAYCAASDVADLLGQVLDRLERDHGRECVGSALGFIESSAYGLSDDAICRLTRLTPYAWAKLRNEFGDSLRDVGSRVILGHDHVRKVVRERYLSGMDAMDAQTRLADFLWNEPASPERAEELGLHLRIIEDFDRLQSCLCDMEFLATLCERRGLRGAVLEWRALQRGGKDVEALLCSALKRWVGEPSAWGPRDVDYGFWVQSVLGDLACFGSAAQALCQDLVEGCAVALGVQHRLAFRARVNQARWLEQAGQLTAALALLRTVEVDAAAHYGSEHDETIAISAQVAHVLAACGDASAVFDQDRRMLDLQLKKKGDSDPDAIAALIAVAVSAQDCGQVDLALECAERAAHLARLHIGVRHSATIAAEKCLANVRAIRGEYAGALDLFVDLIKRASESLGEQHLTTLELKSDLAVLLIDIGKYEDGFAIQQELVEISTARFGADHPRTLMALVNLAGTKFALGDYAGSEHLERTVLEGRLRVLGPLHPHTLAGMCNLSQSALAQGKYTEAQTLLERVHDGRRKVFGDDHPQTIDALHKLGVVALKQNAPKRAVEFMRAATEAYMRILNETHPSVLRCRGDYGEALRVAGRTQEAEALLRIVFEQSVDAFGSEHPLTLSNINVLGLVLLETGNYADALDCVQHIYNVRLRDLGPDHPFTIDSRNGVAVVKARMGRR